MLVVFGEDAERLVELAAGFTGLDHQSIKIRQPTGSPTERFRERGPGAHLIEGPPYFFRLLAGVRVDLVQRVADAHAGLLQHTELMIKLRTPLVAARGFNQGGHSSREGSRD